MRKVMATHRDSTWTLIVDMLSQWKILRFCDVNRSVFTIKFPNGSKLMFRGADDIEKLKSIAKVDDIWAEEASEFTEEDILQLDLRLRSAQPNLQFFFSFNPVSKANWTYKRWFSVDSVNDATTMVLKTTYKDNRFLPKEYIEALERMIKTNPAWYKIYALGEFTSLDRLVFTNWRSERFALEEVKTLPLLIGVDFGYVNDATALVLAYLDEINKKIYVAKSLGRTGMLNVDIFKLIEAQGLSKSIIIADSAEPKSIEEIKRMGVPRIRASHKGPDSVRNGIQKLQKYELIIAPDCDNLITELENYSWRKDKKTGEYLNEPVDDFNHWIDALRYSLQCADTSQSLQAVSKSVFGL